jgi:hypothetical protein
VESIPATFHESGFTDDCSACCVKISIRLRTSEHHEHRPNKSFQAAHNCRLLALPCNSGQRL